MRKSTKNWIMLAFIVVLLGGLGGTYLWLNSREQPAEEPEDTVNPLVLVSRPDTDIVSVTFYRPDNNMTIRNELTTDENGEELSNWVYADDPEIVLEQLNASYMVRAFYVLVATEMVMEVAENLAEYGLDPAAATLVCTYRDGSTATLYMGSFTTDANRMYFMMEGNPALYLMDAYLGERYLFDVGYSMDKSIPEIQVDYFEYAYIRERDKQVIECAFRGTDEQKDAMIEEYGSTTMFMLQPYPDREMYYSNFSERVLVDYLTMTTLDELVELYPTDYAQYGLDDPILEVQLRDVNNETHFLFGDEVDDYYIYCKMYDKPYVFKVQKWYLSRLYDINAFSFLERFVLMVNIADCDAMSIAYAGDETPTYEMKVNFVPKDTEDEMMPYVNGKLVDDTAFRVFYRNMIMISYESEIEAYTPTGEADIVLTLHLLSGEEVVTRFYAYDANFYAVQRDDNPIQFVTTRVSVQFMLDSIAELAG